MPELPFGNTPPGHSENTTTGSQPAADRSAGELAEGSICLNIAQRRFAEALGQGLAGTWRRDSSSVDEIRGDGAKPLNV
jgi:hypothetical protein